ncbi:hypothetical protein FDC58_07570 [Clostridium botulinum]|uniref:hypothetical protein n=1 Tax=Clostridium TaxID=1485 RepID=UPI00050656E9|nr:MULTISPECIES: hypothetical protein [Clostridium]AIY82149.1 hypothetical protein U728_2625 [Clostridium botulinum 202F]KAI3345330.1 hypothetical protein CIT17_13965 [Clostridium botulinum]KFX57830.1 hypothetical protein KU40_05870 [Clostridium botulinum]KFX59896.1 hypothetical protein KU41_02880 [Clostridium botulinum]KON11603.1 hypothetical protein ACP50_17525 [Clostridium botulinum]
MKGFIIDSTYKEDIVIDKNNINSTVPCNNISNNSSNGSKINLNDVSSSYITHYNKDNKYNPYNVVDYL